jgi:hypothetical protein
VKPPQTKPSLSTRKHFDPKLWLRIPRHSATRSTNIRPVIPPTSGHPFHEHPATWEAGLRGKLSSLISGYPVKGFPG